VLGWEGRSPHPGHYLSTGPVGILEAVVEAFDCAALEFWERATYTWLEADSLLQCVEKRKSLRSHKMMEHIYSKFLPPEKIEPTQPEIELAF